MYKLLLCDDHPLVIEGLRLILKDEEQYEIVGEAANGKEAIEFIKENEVDLLMMDINMPVLNGLEACKIINAKFPKIKIVMLSMLNDLHIVKHLFQHGAMAYMMKNAGHEEIVDTLNQVVQGKKVFDNEILIEILALKKSKAKAKSQSLFPKLSRREKEILGLIIKEYTTAEIASELFIGFGTVETHRRNMLNKLGLRNTAGLVRTALEFGLLT